MGSLTALVLATPIFGFALTPPTVAPGAMPPAAFLPPIFAQVDDAEPDGGDAEAEDDGGEGLDDGVDAPPPEDEGDGAGADDYVAQMRRRAELSKVHRTLGIATWGAMTATLIIGGIQYNNLYGFFSNLEDTPCVRGTAAFGQDQCSGTPWLHLGASLITSGLYTSTLVLSMMMPDPDGLDEGDSAFARTLRMHKLLRWVHLGGMVAQMLLGIVVANADNFGIDRANDYGTLQALATVHMAIGFVTYGALTWAGALMIL